MPSNLTTGQVLPGFFGYVDYNTQGGGQAPTKRALLWGYISASAQRTPNQPFLPASQQEADDGAGRGSDLANAYAAAVSQPESQGADIWLMPITPSSGNVASVYTLKVYGTPTKSGTIQLWINSMPIPAVGFTTSDTATTIATALTAAILTVLDLPLGTSTSSTDTITIPYMHKGAVGEDLPFRCNISPGGSGVTLSPGAATFSGSAGATGSFKLEMGSLSVSTAITNGDTAPVIAAAVIASWNADTYPLTAVVDGSSTSKVNFMFANDCDVHRMRGSLITTSTTTVNLGSGATDGTGSASSFSYNGTLGVGAPSISTAITNLGALGMFRSWSSPFIDSTTMGTMATNIEASSDGSISGQKQQTLTMCDFRAASVTGALLTASSPNLTSSAPHYAMGWAPDTSVQTALISARLAAARAAIWLDTPQKNWNGFQIKGTARSPILAPSSSPSQLAQNTALRTYALAPIVLGGSGNLEVVKGRTTSLANDLRLWAWSSEAQAAYHCVDLALYFKELFQGGSLLQYSTPKAPGVFDTQSFKSATQARMRFWERNGNYDGADALADAVKATKNVSNPFRVDVKFPESPVLDLDQIVFTGLFAQPST